MREQTKSVVSTSWALSLFGAQQLAGIVSRRSEIGSHITATPSLDAVANVARSRLSNGFQHFYDLGDEAQRGMVDLVGAAAQLKLSGLLKPSIDVANPLVQGFGLVTPQRDWLTDWQELRNKIDIFDLVQSVETRVNAQPDFPLYELVDRAYGLGDFHALWAVEGLGHYYGEQALDNSDNPQRLLTDPASLGLPDKSLTMLNAGIGMAFAQKLLGELPPKSPRESLDRIVERFVELCRSNATPGYKGASLESLGLVTRTFHPKLLAAVDQSILSSGNLELLGYFWHGAGRGTYFSRTHFLPLPCSSIRWDRVANQASHEIGRHNIIAGLAWAVTLVNMRTPEVMDRLLQHRGKQILDHEGFANGVASSIVMRSDTTPNAAFVRSFFERSNTASPTSDLWSTLIDQSGVYSLSRLYPALRLRKQLENVFRFQPFSGSANNVGFESNNLVNGA